jgi:hypothetical protein
LGDRSDFDAPDVDVNLVGLALGWLETACGFGFRGSSGRRVRK